MKPFNVKVKVIPPKGYKPKTFTGLVMADNMELAMKSAVKCLEKGIKVKNSEALPLTFKVIDAVSIPHTFVCDQNILTQS
jgi:hypothetical protein